jgi:hypothetical protein
MSIRESYLLCEVAEEAKLLENPNYQNVLVSEPPSELIPLASETFANFLRYAAVGSRYRIRLSIERVGEPGS